MHVVTLTLSPALDIFYDTDQELNVSGESVFRTSKEQFEPGGKGFNVGRALEAYSPKKTKITNLVCLGGESGKHWLRLANELGSRVIYVPTNHQTRTNVHLYGQNHTEIKVNGNSGSLNINEIEDILLYIENLKPDVLVVSGSFPDIEIDDFEERILELAKTHNFTPTLDITGKPLAKFINAGLPQGSVIKINRDEYNQLKDSFEDWDPTPYIFFKKYNLNWIITNGSKEITGHLNGENAIGIPQNRFSGNVSVGAGDYFLGGLVAAQLSAKSNLKDQIQIANAFSAARLTGSEPTQSWIENNLGKYEIEWSDEILKG